MRSLITFLVFILNLFVITFNISSQNIHQENHFIQNYNHKNYGTPENQIWSILQDLRGVMFFGNNSGILEFDGTYWRLIPLSNKSTVRSLALDTATNTVYVGGVGELGYLQTDSTGSLNYVSLIHKIPEKYRAFEDVWQITILNNQIIFRTSHALFILKDDIFKTLVPENRFHVGFLVNNQYYIREWEKGLFVLKDDKLEFVGQSGIFANERIYVMLPYERNKILIATRTQGVYIFSPNSITDRFIKPDKFKQINTFLTGNQTYCGIQTCNNLFAIGTSQNGFILFNKDAEILYHINKNSGLIDDNVLTLFTDAQNNIWAGLNNGISRININSPFTYYNDKNGLNGTVYNVKIHNNKLYAGTSLGLFVKDNNSTFTLVENTKGRSWSLTEINGILFLAHSDGIFKVNNNKAQKILSDLGTVWNLNKLEGKSLLLTGTNNGIFLLELRNGNLLVKNKLEGFNEDARYLSIYKNTIWISHPNKSVYKLVLNESSDSIVKIHFYDSNNGLPSNTNNYVFKIKSEDKTNQIVFGTEKGIYKYDQQKNIFIPDTNFFVLSKNEGYIDKFVQDKNGNIYFQQSRTKGILILQNDGSYKVTTPFLKLQDTYFENITIIDSTNILLSTREGAIRYNSKIKPTYNSYRTLIRSVYANDSLIFGGDTNWEKEINLPFKYNNLVFTYSALFYEDHTKTEYNYLLEGYGSPTDKWSEWSTKTEKEYTNLPSGSYTFKVKAINTYNKISQEAIFKFNILTPWYRTVFAYIAYSILAICIIWILIHIFTSKLKIENEVLEGIILQRTRDLQETNTQLEEKQSDLEVKQEEIKAQAENLALVNKELEKHKKHLENLVEVRTHDLKIAKEKAEESDRLKTAFLANMSHEIRTPMNAIIGFADLLNDPEINQETKDELILLINHNSDTLLNLIDDIIDISKIESGQLQIRKRVCSINDILEKLLKTFNEKKINMKKDHIDIKLKTDEKHPSINLDTDPLRFQQIITNFIDNALKFTEKGEIEVGYYINNADKKNITFYVKDTGIGLKEDEVKLIFERFSKIDNKKTKLYRGAGLGLTISKNLAQMLGGDIGVKSKLNQGSTFYFSLPFKA